jgi:hypothetical protein
VTPPVIIGKAMHRRTTKIGWTILVSTIWILSVLLIAGSLDSWPDPPAVVPHMVSVKILGASECAKGVGDRLGNIHFPSLLAVHPHGVILAEDAEPNRPAECVSKTRLASDASPPTRGRQS